MGEREPFPWLLFFVWAALAAAGYLAFSRNRDWAWKERWFAPVAWLTLVASAAWMALGGYRSGRFVPIVVAVMTVTGIRNTRFCHRCGRTNVLRGNPKPRHCRECGHELTA